MDGVVDFPYFAYGIVVCSVQFSAANALDSLGEGSDVGKIGRLFYLGRRRGKVASWLEQAQERE